MEEEKLFPEVERAARILLSASYVIAVVGAGISAESGIPTFRGPGGLWTRFGEPPMDGYQRFLADPIAHWKQQVQPPEGYRVEMHRALEKARPNPGHYALAELEALGILKYTITQNVDNLHAEAGSRKLVELHGNRFKLRCIGCGLRFPRVEFRIVELPPRCPECGGLVKGDGVMFGEPIPHAWLKVCEEQTELGDCVLLVGTSGVVYPAAAFPQQVHARRGTLIEVNPLPTQLSHLCRLILRAPSAQALPLVVRKVKELQGKPVS